MSAQITFPDAAARYDAALKYAESRHKPIDHPSPRYSSEWPEAYRELLQQFVDWLQGGGSSPDTIQRLYITMAGHALGFNHKTIKRVDLDSDLEIALDYIKSKGLSAEWTDMCRNALNKFRTYLRQKRGGVDVTFKTVDIDKYCTNLPGWLTSQMRAHLRIKQAGWHPARCHQLTLNYLSKFRRLWRWLLDSFEIQGFDDLKRQHIFAYMDERLEKKYAPSGINQDVRAFQSLLRFLEEQGELIPRSLLRIRSLKQPEQLPRYLTDEQVRKLRDDLEDQVNNAPNSNQYRDACLDRAVFYLLWHGGLRLGEVEVLQIADLNLEQNRLTVRWGKGAKDRTVYLTDVAVKVLKTYLELRGQGTTDHVFLYRNHRLTKDMVHRRLKACGKRTGVHVTAHRLRHTYATQLVNAGCRITSLQKLLGHERLNSTMIYAKVYDATVEDDYYKAMAAIEQELQLLDIPSTQTLMVARILNLLDSVMNGPLNTKQQAMLNELKALLHHEIQFNQTTADAAHTYRNGVLH